MASPETPKYQVFWMESQAVNPQRQKLLNAIAGQERVLTQFNESKYTSPEKGYGNQAAIAKSGWVSSHLVMTFATELSLFCYFGESKIREDT
jgi:hypothetical protein